MFPATVDTSWLNGWGAVVMLNHSSPHGSNKSRFDKSRTACSGNAQTNGFRCKITPTLPQSTEATSRSLSSADTFLTATPRLNQKSGLVRHGPLTWTYLSYCEKLRYSTDRDGTRSYHLSYRAISDTGATHSYTLCGWHTRSDI